MASRDPLDASQKAFVEAPEGANIRLLAPAGCGKTLCLLHRCKHLKDLTSKRTRFLIAMFTQPAQQELSARLNENPAFSDLRDLVKVTTLNSWGWQRIRNMDSVDNPKLITKDIRKFLMHNDLKLVWKKKKYEKIKRAISNKKNNKNKISKDLIDVIDDFKSLGFDHSYHSDLSKFSSHIDALCEQNLGQLFQRSLDVLRRYEILIRNNNGGVHPLCDQEKKDIYDSFFGFWRDCCEHLLGSDKFTLEDQKYVACRNEEEQLAENKLPVGIAKYDHVFVDEFQDINYLDLKLIKVIAKRNRATLTIVGDDDQAIFGWRGASSKYILNPDQFFGLPFEGYTLEINYRSPANVVEHSQHLIKNNNNRVNKTISSHITEEADIQVHKTDHISQDIKYVQKIFEQNNKNQESNRIAIIGRKRAQIIPYQIYFASEGIPFYAAEDLQILLSDAFGKLIDLLEIKEKANDEQDKFKLVRQVLKLCNLVNRYPLNKKEKDLRKHFNNSEADFQNMSQAISILYSYNQDMAIRLQKFIDADTVSEALKSLSDNFRGLQYDFGKAEDDIFYADPPFSYCRLHDTGIRQSVLRLL